MHQPVFAPETTSAPARVSLRAGDRWVRVPAWWAAENLYSHGGTVASDDEAAARDAEAIADMLDRMAR